MTDFYQCHCGKVDWFDNPEDVRCSRCSSFSLHRMLVSEVLKVLRDWNTLKEGLKKLSEDIGKEYEPVKKT